MKILLDILRGIIIGITNVVPGVSGGTIAVAMGIYEKLIYAINNIFKEPLKCIKLIWTYVIGIAIGIVLSISGITFLLEIEPIATSMLFTGLILGSLPMLVSYVKNERFGKRDYITFSIMVAIILFLPVIGVGETVTITNSISTAFILFILGLVAAITMIIPGVSGSMVLMALGYYNTIMEKISSCINSALLLNIPKAFSDGVILIPMILGIIIGIFAIAKVIAYLLKKHKATLYWGIIGLIVASPFAIIYKLDIINIHIGEAIASVVMLVVGMIVAIMFAKKENKEEENKNV